MKRMLFFEEDEEKNEGEGEFANRGAASLVSVARELEVSGVVHGGYVGGSAKMHRRWLARMLVVDRVSFFSVVCRRRTREIEIVVAACC